MATPSPVARTACSQPAECEWPGRKTCLEPLRPARSAPQPRSTQHAARADNHNASARHPTSRVPPMNPAQPTSPLPSPSPRTPHLPSNLHPAPAHSSAHHPSTLLSRSPAARQDQPAQGKRGTPVCQFCSRTGRGGDGARYPAVLSAICAFRFGSTTEVSNAFL